jgi:transcriptional antiterminator RfaH
MFPGYLFAAVDQETQRWRPILSTYGVCGVVTTGASPGSVPDAFIEALRAREVDGLIVRPGTPFHLGQTVRLNLPAFDGLVAEIIGLDDNERLLVLMTVLNRPVKVRVPVAAVSEIVGG